MKMSLTFAVMLSVYIEICFSTSQRMFHLIVHVHNLVGNIINFPSLYNLLLLLLLFTLLSAFTVGGWEIAYNELFDR